MVSLTQNEIAQYLLDYANFNALTLQKSKISSISLFKNYMSNSNIDDIPKYYHRMINVFVLFCNMKMYSIYEDYNLKNKNNFINNENLNLSSIEHAIKINDNSTSNKKLLQLLKDSFCHSNYNNQLYNISLNGKYIQFNLKNNSISVKLSIDDISSLTKAIDNSTETIQMSSLEYKKIFNNIKEFLNNLVIKRYYFTKKIDKEIINNISNHSKKGNYYDAINEANNIDSCITKEFMLTKEQINDVISLINELTESNTISDEEYHQYFIQIINILVSKHYPIPIFKSEYFKIDSFVAYYLQSIEKFSYEDIYRIITYIIPNKETKEFTFEKCYDKVFNNPYDKLFIKTHFSNYNEKLIYPYMLFFEYIINNYCIENEYIKIGKRSVLANKLRNSLVHSRWYINKDKIVFYDAYTNITNETEYNWETSLKFDDLCEYCETILKQHQEQNKVLIKTLN